MSHGHVCYVQNIDVLYFLWYFMNFEFYERIDFYKHHTLMRVNDEK